MPTKQTKPTKPTHLATPQPPPAPLDGGQADDTETAEPVDTLEDLVARAGDATEEEVLAFVEGMSESELVKLGTEVATSRIDVDTARLYGKAFRFFAGATAAQRAAVPGTTPDMLRVAIWSARQGQLLAEQRGLGKTSKGNGKDLRGVEADTIRAQGLARREQLNTVLVSIGRKDPTTREMIAKAYGSIATPKAHADALVAQVKLCRTFVKDQSPAAVLRRRGTAVSEAWLKESEALAERVRKSGTAAAAVQGDGKVTQAAVDRWDGINLSLLHMFIEAFEIGNGIDPHVPRLVPISLRRWFGRGQRPAAAEEGDETTTDEEDAAPADAGEDASAEEDAAAESDEAEPAEEKPAAKPAAKAAAKPAAKAPAKPAASNGKTKPAKG